MKMFLMWLDSLIKINEDIDYDRLSSMGFGCHNPVNAETGDVLISAYFAMRDKVRRV